MDIVVSGRNVEVPDHYRTHVADKLSRIEKFDHKLIRINVELQHEPNRRQSNACQHVEITCKSRGPVIRAEACEGDFYTALDNAVSRLEARLRKAADRRRVHYGHRRRTSVSDAAGRIDAAPAEALGAKVSQDDAAGETPEDSYADDSYVDDGPGRIVRYKEHSAAPMSIDQALHEMELVGHDFYLFADADTGLPSVVYRRKGYDYGVIRLGSEAAAPIPVLERDESVPVPTTTAAEEPEAPPAAASPPPQVTVARTSTTREFAVRF
ncbi:MAG TPA: ribosome-associated translation inhibitor RaiA [Mycobacteriales bacterium]|nr:ribosome-associated translation inhibitor RaiA [Mycobacteriales bacterium]